MQVGRLEVREGNVDNEGCLYWGCLYGFIIFCFFVFWLEWLIFIGRVCLRKSMYDLVFHGLNF
jgi:hypothetical protein